MASQRLFYYFAFGSNLLKERIILANPSAVLMAIGVVHDHKLTMCRRDENSVWSGATATICAAPGENVYGTLWQLDIEDRKTLDIQEGVAKGIYKPGDCVVNITSTIAGKDSLQVGQKVPALTYQMLDETPAITSPFYLDIVLRGAVQSGLPEDYVKQLREIPHNSYSGQCPMYMTVLGLIAKEEQDKFEVPFLKTLNLL